MEEKASDGIVATQSRVYFGLRCKIKKLNENRWLGFQLRGQRNSRVNQMIP